VLSIGRGDDSEVLQQVNGRMDRWRSQITALLHDPRMPVVCPTCEILPRDFPEACAVLSLAPEVLPWQLSVVQVPARFLGNHLSNAFFAYAAAQARGVAFFVVVPKLEQPGFQRFFPYLWHFYRSLPERGFGGATAAQEVDCQGCRGHYPHECTEHWNLWEELALPFATVLRDALNASIARFWPKLTPTLAKVPGWPGDFNANRHRRSRSVAAHVRCGDALAQKGDEWGLLPLSAYKRVVREGDFLVLVTAATRGSDKPFQGICSQVMHGLAYLLGAHFEVVVSTLVDGDPGLDFARLAFADAVLCGPSSTYCLWAALAAASRGAEVHVASGRLFMNGSRPRIPGVSWFSPPPLARGTDPAKLLHFIEHH